MSNLEIWKPIPRHPGYEASSLGRVRSIDRTIYDKNGHAKRLRGKVLKPYFNEETCPYGAFRAGSKMGKVHVSVAEAFHGRAPIDKPYVCHKDGQPTNNRPDNLYWGTAQENQLDRHRHPTTTQGEAHPHARLSESDVIQIRARLLRGEKQRVVANDYGVNQSQISNINTGARWAHV